VTDVYRVWSWEKSQFDKNVFKNYVRLFMRLKIESSGFPENVISLEERADWAAKYKDRYDIDIELGKVAYNPGLRHISKIALNSLW